MNYEETQRQVLLSAFAHLSSYEKNVIAEYLQVRGELAECTKSIASHENQLEYEKGRKIRLTQKYVEALGKMKEVMSEAADE